MNLVARRAMGRALVLTVALSGAIALSGCGPGTGGLYGKVTYNDKAVTGGKLLLRPKASANSPSGDISGTINPDGTFTVVGVPPGEYLVGIDTESLNVDPDDPANKPYRGMTPPPDKSAEAPKPPPSQVTPGTYMRLPANYRNPSQSGITWNTKTEGGKKDIPLKD
jgi:hypothetical protein